VRKVQAVHANWQPSAAEVGGVGSQPLEAGDWIGTEKTHFYEWYKRIFTNGITRIVADCIRDTIRSIRDQRIVTGWHVFRWLAPQSQTAIDIYS
jgi:hypothetical protein